MSEQEARALVSAAVAAGRNALTEWESKQLLAAYGVPVPEGALVTTAEEAAAAAERLGGKLAMKAVGAGILHKTEGGLVVLGVAGPDEAAATFELLRERAGDALEAVLVERTLPGGRELLAGLKRDPVYGPVVAFGLGGVMTEVLGDVAFALAPLDAAEAAGLPDLIGARAVLDEFRGAPAVDRAALSAVLGALSRLAELPQIAEIDVNPLLIDGDRPVAVDALVVLASSAATAASPPPASGAISPPASGASSPPTRPEAGRPALPDLGAVFAPASVAIVGASDDLRKWGGSAMQNLIEGGYTGAVYPVNPRGGVVFGLPAYASVDDLPEAPDLVVIVVNGPLVAGVLESCVRRGARGVVVITAGFAETGGEGAGAEEELARTAEEAGITLIGPNCVGLMANERDLHITGFVTMEPALANLSFVSQSGSMGAIVVSACQRHGVGLDKFLSVGNEARVTACDVLDYLRDDPGTSCAMLYLEGVSDGRRFYEAARAAAAVKPVVVLRGGRTEAGGKAAASHTAALAGSSAVFAAAARQAGVVTCTTVDELVELAAAFAYLPLPQGRRVAVVTNGGGPGVLAADEVALNGLTMAEIPEGVFAELDQLLPPFWSRRNPLDLVAAGLNDTGLRAIELVARSPEVDAVLALSFIGVPALRDADDRPVDGQYQAFTEWEEECLRHTAAVMEASGKPIISVFDHPVRGSILGFHDTYAPVIVSSPQAAARVLDKLAWYAEQRRANG